MRPAYPLCPLCNRITRGFGYSNPRLFLWIRAGAESMRCFCSRNCQEFYAAIKKQYGEDCVIDPTPQEIAAIRAAVNPMAEYVGAEIGFDKPLAQYSREQVLALVEVIVTAYHDAILSATHAQWPNITIPYDPTKRLGGSK